MMKSVNLIKPEKPACEFNYAKQCDSKNNRINNDNFMRCKQASRCIEFTIRGPL